MAVYIDKELCKSCKICISICPKDVFAITHHVTKKATTTSRRSMRRIASPAASVKTAVPTS